MEISIYNVKSSLFQKLKERTSQHLLTQLQGD